MAKQKSNPYKGLVDMAWRMIGVRGELSFLATVQEHVKELNHMTQQVARLQRANAELQVENAKLIVQRYNEHKQREVIDIKSDSLDTSSDKDS